MIVHLFAASYVGQRLQKEALQIMRLENRRNFILMKLKRKWIATMCIAVTAAMVGGCGSQKKDKTVEKIDYDKCVTLGDYKNISLESSQIDSQTKLQIDQVLQNNSTYDKITKGKVAEGDTINIFYVGKMNGTAFEGGTLTEKEQPEGYDLKIGGGQFIPGFEDALIGKKIGETCDINLTFPDPYENNPDLAGKPVVFTVTINSKQGEEHIPELTDEFVKEKISETETAESYQKTIRETALEEQAWSYVYEASKINEYPKQKLKDLTQRMSKSINYYLSQQGISMEQYLEAQKLSQEDYDKQMEESAKQNLGNMLIYEAIAEKEKITVSEEEYQEDLKAVMENNNLKDEKAADEMFQSYYGTNAKDILMDDLLNNKVKEYLAGNVTEK